MISNQIIELKTNVLGRRLASHLLRRTTFNITHERISLFSNFTPSQAVAHLFASNEYFREYPLDSDFVPWLDPNNTEVTSVGIGPHKRDIMYWWHDESRRDESIHSKLAMFLHQNFMVHQINGSFSSLFDYLKMLRYYSTKSYQDLAYAMTRSGIMLSYLNGDFSTKNEPNENYAREFLELFTIGKGPQNPNDQSDYTYYTEHDVQQAAKVFTGIQKGSWDIDPKSGYRLGKIKSHLHDTTTKTFSHRFNNATIQGATTPATIATEVKAFIAMVFNQDRTAINIAEKLYRYFVNKNISDTTQDNIILPLAQTLKDNNYNIMLAVKMLLKSKHFYDEDDLDATDHIIGGMIKSPYDLALQTMNYFDYTIIDYSNYLNAKQAVLDAGGIVDDDLLPPKKHSNRFYSLIFKRSFLYPSGMPIFSPHSVAGYDGYFLAPEYDYNWISVSTIRARYEWMQTLISGYSNVLGKKVPEKVKLDVVDSAIQIMNYETALIKDADVLVTRIIEDLFPEGENISESRFNYFFYGVFLDISNYESQESETDKVTAKMSWKFSWEDFMSTNDKSEVQIPLKRLFIALFQSPEYQSN
ncbi:MAG: DUF1800 family protein [Flavobacteriales bacterium]